MPKNIQDIDVVVLAGGLGTRLRSIITSVPKVLANVDGRPFIYYLLDSLCNIGICRVILSTGYQADQLEKSLGAQYKSIHISYSKESTPLGTGG
ncbi:MAG: NTP transferase domain-containing protein, partial [Anaerolineales bacterium]|nr:NTP transferase domain-containing protein [Anaerolineales bacterium]